MAHLIVAAELADIAQKDMDYNPALSTPNHRDRAIAAFEDAVAALEATVLTKVGTPDAGDEDAIKYARTGGHLLAIPRSLGYKARGVTQGSREDLGHAGGPGINYHSSGVTLHTVRTALLGKRQRSRTMGIEDVSTAFLQSEPYPKGPVKYVCVGDPRTKQWTYCRQSGPICGEVIAPTPWEDTTAPWFEETGFARGHNERSCVYNDDNDPRIILYADDCLADGDADDVK